MDCLLTLVFFSRFLYPVSRRSSNFLHASQSGGRSARSLAVADVNKDGIPDVIVANGSTVGSGGGVGVLFGIGGGTLSPHKPTPCSLRELKLSLFGTFNGDGWPRPGGGSNGVCVRPNA